MTTTIGPLELDPVFAQMGAATIQHVWAIPQLTDREKVFLSVTADVCQQALGMPFERHVRRGLGSRMSTADILALVRVLASYSAHHPAVKRLGRLARVWA